MTPKTASRFAPSASRLVHTLCACSNAVIQFLAPFPLPCAPLFTRELARRLPYERGALEKRKRGRHGRTGGRTNRLLRRARARGGDASAPASKSGANKKRRARSHDAIFHQLLMRARQSRLV